LRVGLAEPGKEVVGLAEAGVACDTRAAATATGGERYVTGLTP
jgi:hypothetical protein